MKAIHFPAIGVASILLLVTATQASAQEEQAQRAYSDDQLSATPFEPLIPPQVEQPKGPKEDPSTDPHDFQGMWRSAPLPGAGFFAPLDAPTLPSAQAVVDLAVEANANGLIVGSAWTTCRASSITATLTPLNIISVVQSRNELAILFEEPRMWRSIPFGAAHPETITPSYTANSVAWWDGDTLVIDTIGSNGIGEFDMAAHPYSDQLHVVERITKSADGMQLDLEVTITDPEYYAEPFTTLRRWRWAGGERQTEYDCAENPDGSMMESTVFLDDFYEPICIMEENSDHDVVPVICSRKPEDEI